jgi:hypothetical protein
LAKPYSLTQLVTILSSNKIEKFVILYRNTRFIKLMEKEEYIIITAKLGLVLLKRAKAYRA